MPITRPMMKTISMIMISVCRSMDMPVLLSARLLARRASEILHSSLLHEQSTIVQRLRTPTRRMPLLITSVRAIQRKLAIRERPEPIERMIRQRIVPSTQLRISRLELLVVSKSDTQLQERFLQRRWLVIKECTLCQFDQQRLTGFSREPRDISRCLHKDPLLVHQIQRNFF